MAGRTSSPSGRDGNASPITGPSSGGMQRRGVSCCGSEAMPEKVASLRNPGEQFNEEALVRRVKDGEHDLFYDLVRPYERRLYAAAFAILRNEADAEDAGQEAVLKAFKHIRQFRAESRFSTWLTQITVNEARMRKRKEHANLVEPITDHQDEEGNYTPREFAACQQ